MENAYSFEAITLRALEQNGQSVALTPHPRRAALAGVQDLVLHFPILLALNVTRFCRRKTWTCPFPMRRQMESLLAMTGPRTKTLGHSGIATPLLEISH